MAVKRGQPRKYPWGALFRRNEFTLIEGVDYTCSRASMLQMIRNQASGRELPIKITQRDDRITVRVME